MSGWRTRCCYASRRAFLAARDAFLRLGGSQPLLLPRLLPIGEPEEALLLLDPELGLALRPAIGPIGAACC